MAGYLGSLGTPTQDNAPGRWHLRDVNDARISDVWPFVPPPEYRDMQFMASEAGATSHWRMDEDGIAAPVVADNFDSDTLDEYETEANNASASWSWNETEEWVEIRTGDNITFWFRQDVNIPDEGYARLEFIKRNDYPDDNSCALRLESEGGDAYSFNFQGSNYANQGVRFILEDGTVEVEDIGTGTIDSNGNLFVLEFFWTREELWLVIGGTEVSRITIPYALDLSKWAISSNQIDYDITLLYIGKEQDPAIRDSIGSNHLPFDVGDWPTFGESLVAQGGKSLSDGRGEVDVFDDRTSDLTIEFWFLLHEAISGTSTFLYNGNNGATGYGFRLDGDEVGLLLGGETYNALDSMVALPIGTPVHIVLTRGTTTWRLYLDGVEQATGNTDPIAIDPADTFRVIAANAFDIDEVAFYPRELTASEVADNYEVGSGQWQAPLRWEPLNYDEVVLEDNPFLYYRLGEDPGSSSPIDDSGNGHTGSYVGQVSLGETGLLHQDSDTAVHFDGDGAHLIIDNHDDINVGPHAERSVELWFRPEDVVNRQMLYEQGGGTRGIAIYIDDGEIYCHIWNDSDDDEDSPWGPSWVSTAIEEGVPYHIALVFDSSAGVEGFLNGESIGVDTTANGALHTHSNGNAIGAVNSSSRFHDGTTSLTEATGYHYLGVIDELALYAHALSASRVGLHYAAGTMRAE